MSTTTELPAAAPLVVMSRMFDAPREMVWEAMTEARHVANWWGGPGFTNPVCEMDVRPGGLWRHVMRFPNGYELHMDFVFVEVEKPRKLVWRHADQGKRKEGLPTSITTVTLEAIGDRTEWRMVARFDSLAERDAAVAVGFAAPIEASAARLVDYLQTISRETLT
jgi:uncharacterized protein YndB with AHSA1/START domain